MEGMQGSDNGSNINLTANFSRSDIRLMIFLIILNQPSSQNEKYNKATLFYTFYMY